MRVLVRLKNTSQPLTFEDVTNAYEKGSFYCLYMKASNKVKKIPIADIFDVDENYS